MRKATLRHGWYVIDDYFDRRVRLIVEESIVQSVRIEKMYTGYTGALANNTSSLKSLNYSMASVSLNNRSTSLLQEPHIVTLQKEVDNYTRKVEHEKRRLFSLEESLNMVLREL